MEAQRAQEITNSVNMTNVFYNGAKVYIEHVDRDNGIATIHPLDDPDKKQSVSISSLKEQ